MKVFHLTELTVTEMDLNAIEYKRILLCSNTGLWHCGYWADGYFFSETKTVYAKGEIVAIAELPILNLLNQE